MLSGNSTPGKSGDKQPDSIHLGPLSFLLPQNLLRRSARCKLLNYDSWCHITNKQSILSDTKKGGTKDRICDESIKLDSQFLQSPLKHPHRLTSLPPSCPSKDKGQTGDHARVGKEEKHMIFQTQKQEWPSASLLGLWNEGRTKITPQVPLSSKRFGDCRFITLHYPLLYTLQRDFLSH